MEWVLGVSTAALSAGTLYYRRCFKANMARFADYKAKFADHELIIDAEEKAREVFLAYQTYITAYERAESARSKSDALDVALQKSLPIKYYWDTRSWYGVARDLDEYSAQVRQRLAALKDHKKILEEKKSLWDGDKQKKLVLSQAELVLKDLKRAIPVLEGVNQEFPYVMCLKLEQAGCAMQELAGYLGAADEIKPRLEKQIIDFNVETYGRLYYYPYHSYCGKLQLIQQQLKDVEIWCEGWTPQPHQEGLVARLKKRSEELGPLEKYVGTCSEFLAEQKLIEEARRRDQEERRKEESLRAWRQDLKERDQRRSKRSSLESYASYLSIYRGLSKNSSSIVTSPSTRNSILSSSAGSQNPILNEQSSSAQLYQAALTPPVYDASVYVNQPQPSAPSWSDLYGHPRPSAPPLE